MLIFVQHACVTIGLSTKFHDFNSQKSEWNATGAYGSVYSVTDDDVLSLPDMNTNACEFTTCPIVQSERKTYRYTLALAKKFPVVRFFFQVFAHTLKRLQTRKNNLKDQHNKQIAFKC